jgi:hypothetical protein
MAFALFVLLNATLFVRPVELNSALGAVPIYEALILSCLAIASPQVLAQFSPSALHGRPITVCVIGLLLAVVLSHLSHLFIWGARHSGFDFLKVVIYYLLLVAVVNSERRLDIFLFWLAVFIVVAAVLPVLHFHGIITLPSLEAMEQFEIDDNTGERISFPRLMGTGIFNDPNDLSMILVTGVVLCLYLLLNGPVMVRPLWLIGMAACLYAFWLTKSRGGLLALMVAGTVLAHARWGSRRALIVATALLPMLLLGFAARGNSMTTGTGQSRLQLWSDGLVLFRQQPIFGIGHGLYAEEVGHVAHNSFVHCFTELGVFGGTLFLGAFILAIHSLYRMRSDFGLSTAETTRSRLATVTAVIAGFAISQLSLSRAYVAPTYMMLGFATACANHVEPYLYNPLPKCDLNIASRIACAGALFLCCIYVYVRVAVRW